MALHFIINSGSYNPVHRGLTTFSRLNKKLVSSKVGKLFAHSPFFHSSNRTEEFDEMSYMKELTSASEPTQIQLGLLWVNKLVQTVRGWQSSFLVNISGWTVFSLHRWESSSQSLRLHLLQVKNLNRSIVRDGYKVWVLSALKMKEILVEELKWQKEMTLY